MRSGKGQSKPRASKARDGTAKLRDIRWTGDALERSMAEEDRIRFLRPKEKVPVYESTGTHRYDYPDWNV